MVEKSLPGQASRSLSNCLEGRCCCVCVRGSATRAVHVLIFSSFPFRSHTASPKTFDFRYALNKETGDLDLDCSVTGVFPRPVLSLSQQDPSEGGELRLRPLKEGVDSNYTLNAAGLFDASIRYAVKESYLQSATASNVGTKFECTVTIDEAKVARKKRISLYPSE